MSIDTYLGNSESFIWEAIKWYPSNKQIDQLKHLQLLLQEWNKKVNLTRLTEGDDYWIAQVCDSLWPLRKELQSPNQLFNYIDVGSGCGFPGLAISIALPDSKITLIDSSEKKINILKHFATELGLSSKVQIRAERVENTGNNPSFRGRYNFAMARAVASPAVVAEYLVPLLTIQGEALIYRARWKTEETKSLQKALTHLKAKIISIQKFELPANRGVRHVIRIKSHETCPKKFPRTIGKALKHPLK